MQNLLTMPEQGCRLICITGLITGLQARNVILADQKHPECGKQRLSQIQLAF